MQAATPVEHATLLHRSLIGDADAAATIAAVVYDELCAIAHRLLQRERPDHTLQTAALVNEAYLRLFDQTQLGWNDKAHFLAVAAKAMRNILVNHARDRRREKRGGGVARRIPLENDLAGEIDRNFDLVELEEVLTRLETLEPQYARMVELRYFAGLDNDECAQVLGISTATLKRDWALARAWLLRELTRENP